ncbi:MAG: lytic transglycosylase domain-containing protein, partial [Actinobacteria bacterium]
ALALAVVALGSALAAPADAAIGDTVEETARRATHLAEIRDGLAGERAATERALLLRTIEVASGLEGSGRQLAAVLERALPVVASVLSPLGIAERAAVDRLGAAIAASVEVDDPAARAASGKVAQLGSWLADLETLIAAEDAAVAAALSSGRRIGPFPAEVERWRPVVAAHFDPHRVNEALVVIGCESGGDPEAGNRRSGAAGLFQFMRGTWEHVTEEAGLGDVSRREPEASIAAAAWLVTESEATGAGPWAHWSCRP